MISLTWKYAWGTQPRFWTLSSWDRDREALLFWRRLRRQTAAHTLRPRLMLPGWLLPELRLPRFTTGRTGETAFGHPVSLEALRSPRGPSTFLMRTLSFFIGMFFTIVWTKCSVFEIFDPLGSKYRPVKIDLQSFHPRDFVVEGQAPRPLLCRSL